MLYDAKVDNYFFQICFVVILSIPLKRAWSSLVVSSLGRSNFNYLNSLELVRVSLVHWYLNFKNFQAPQFCLFCKLAVTC